MGLDTRGKAHGDHVPQPSSTRLRVRFEQHFGEVDRPDAVGADNKQIDADLAREYGDTHEAS